MALSVFQSCQRETDLLNIHSIHLLMEIQPRSHNRYRHLSFPKMIILKFSLKFQLPITPNPLSPRARLSSIRPRDQLVISSMLYHEEHKQHAPWPYTKTLRISGKNLPRNQYRNHCSITLDWMNIWIP